MSDLAALLAAVRERDHDSLPRLVMADAIEEQAAPIAIAASATASATRTPTATPGRGVVWLPMVGR